MSVDAGNRRQEAEVAWLGSDAIGDSVKRQSKRIMLSTL